MTLPDYLKPPDFEVRCDAFVAEVLRKIAPNYPELQIETENYTKEDLIRLTRTIAIAQEMRKGKRLMERLRAADRWKDEVSAYENVATVNMCGRGEVSIQRLVGALDDVILVANKFG